MVKKHKRKTSRSKAHKHTPSSSGSGGAAAVHEVERIVASRVDEAGTEMFRLRWKGCEAADDSWRTREQLDVGDCKEALQEFLDTGVHVLKKVGFKETATLKRVNAAGNSIVEEVGLKG